MRLDSVVRLLEMAAGGFAVGYVNDTYTAPALEGALPSLQTNHMFAKATDTASTAGTAYLGGRLFNAVKLPRVADAVEGGGYFVAALKALATPIDGAEVKLTTPSPLSLFRASLATAPASPALGAPSVSGAPQLTAGAVTSSGPNNIGYANPGSQASAVAGNQASGYQMNTNGTFSSIPAPPSANLDWGI